MSQLATDTVDGSAPPRPEHAAPSSPPRSGKRRVWFVDIVRLLASLQMINGHSLDAVMLPSLKQGSFFETYDWCRGLVSVSFLMVAGIAFYLSTLGDLHRHLHRPGAVRLRFRRAGTIVLIGYLLALPWGALRSDPEASAQAFRHFQSVDVLQVIGVSLILLEVLAVLIRNSRRVIWAAGIGAVLLFAAAPLADAVLLGQDPQFLLNYLSHQGGSRFPLFPWAGFVFAGVVVGAVALPQAGQTPFRTIALRLGLLTAAAFALQAALTRVPWTLMQDGSHDGAAPAFSILKLAAVLAVCFVLALACYPLRQLPKIPRVLASETLTIYSFHLLVLWGPGVGLARLIGPQLSLPVAAGFSAFMLALTITYTMWWHAHKKRRAAARAHALAG